jgi:hypothetical protein
MNYSQKIHRLKDRRQGLYSRDGVYNFVEAITATSKLEKFLQLAEPEAVKYAIGAMQAVDPEYTQKSYAEGNRVRDRLAEGLSTAGIPAVFDYQGSVPLDVHVRGNSDIDLLVLHDGFVTVEAAAQAAYLYLDAPGKAPAEELADLRKECIAILERRFWGAKVDPSPSKAITLTGGSLQRAVDVIPSHWHDTLDWKRTGDKRYRDIYVFDSKAAQRMKNRPFMHIGLIEDKCVNVRGGLRKCIRLMKNLRYDASKTIELSSYDIAAIAWHMTDQELVVPFGVDLLLVERVREHLKFLLDLPAYRDVLLVPDGSRRIFDKPEKAVALADLYQEVERLSADLAREINPLAAYAGLPRSQVLNKAIML